MWKDLILHHLSSNENVPQAFLGTHPLRQRPVEGPGLPGRPGRIPTVSVHSRAWSSLRVLLRESLGAKSPGHEAADRTGF